MELRLQLKILLIQIIFERKVSMNQKAEVKPSFRYFCRFMSGSLTLRPRKTHVYVFRALFGFGNFQVTSCFLQKLGTYSLDSTLNLHSSLYAYTLQFVFLSLLKPALFIPKNLLLLLFTATTTNNKVNAYSGSGPVIKIVGQDRKYKQKLVNQGWYMQTQAPDW